MAKVHISQFYSCSHVKLACELYYIVEVAKYLHMGYGDVLSLDGVILDKCLRKSKLWDMFRIAVDEGWLVDHNLSDDAIAINIQFPLEMSSKDVVNVFLTQDEVPFDREDNTRRHEDEDYNRRVPQRLQVSFERADSEFWIWSPAGKDEMNFNTNNKSMSGNLVQQKWLSLIAMTAVNRLKEGYPQQLFIKLTSHNLVNRMALTYVMLLSDETSCLTGWCNYVLGEDIGYQEQLQMGYRAWYQKGVDLGMLDRWYSGVEKHAYLNELDVKEGDLVFLYERNKEQQYNYVKSIAGCHVARVDKLTKTDIIFTVVNTTKTRIQGKEDFEGKPSVVRQMYITNKGYENLNTSHLSLDINDCGVGYMMLTERYFIVTLEMADEFKALRVTDGERVDTLRLPQNDAVYWILKDYDFQFNEQRFLDRYFGNRTPLYIRYMDGEVLEEGYYVK